MNFWLKVILWIATFFIVFHVFTYENTTSITTGIGDCFHTGWWSGAKDCMK
jgi:hypothetical protein